MLLLVSWGEYWRAGRLDNKTGSFIMPTVTNDDTAILVSFTKLCKLQDFKNKFS